MKRILLAAFALGLAVTAMASIPDADRGWLSKNNLTAPDGMSSAQEKGLHWMITTGCTPGNHTVGGVAVSCVGNKIKDTNNYLDQVAMANLCLALGGCVA